MDGLVTLRELRRRGNKMPVIMCSSLTQRGARVTIEALACGASDYVTKPTGQSSREASLNALAGNSFLKFTRFLVLRSRGRLSSNRRGTSLPLRLPRFRASAVLPRPHRPFSSSNPSRPQPITATPSVVAIGVSTGGPAALDVLLPLLPANLPSACSYRPAHARALYAPLRRAAQWPLQTSRARSCRRRPGRPRNHLHRPRQLAS